MPRRPLRLVPRDDSTPIATVGRHRAFFGDAYVHLLSSSWLRLSLIILLLWISVNVLFTIAYHALGAKIAHAHPDSFSDMFFFSVQTLATIGYGQMAPINTIANLLVALEAFCGFGFYALVTGLVFAKFSRPRARVMFSDQAVISPYNGQPHLMLRLANERANRIVDATVQMVMLRNEVSKEGERMRRFHDMKLVRHRVPMMQLTWTIMHPIDKHSPLHGVTAESLRDCGAEIIVSLTGLDETMSQTIHARHSYMPEEIAFDVRFEDILVRKENGGITVRYDRFHAVKSVAKPES